MSESTDEQRDQVFRRMSEELGRLEVDGIAKETDDAIAVITRSKKVPLPVQLKFMFEPGPENRINGIGVEIGGGGE